MAKYYHSDYALNKNSDAILYRTADGTVVEVTKKDYLAQNPNLTEEQFYELKELSDAIFKEEKNKDRKQERTKVKQVEQIKSQNNLPSCEENLIESEEKQKIKSVTNQLLLSGKLTEVQERRFKLHYIEGFSYRQIAQKEGVHFTSIQECIYACRKKLKKFFKEF